MFPLAAFIPGGMPTVTLSDAAALRLETISFFLLAFFLAAGGVKAVWNLLRRDWPALPRLNYAASLGFTAVWGCLFVLVLTMISGTRELLTPGAWEKQGLTYRLKEGGSLPPPPDASDEDRRRRLEDLGRALLLFAAVHDGRLPSREETAEIGDVLWRLPNRPASTYVYFPGGSVVGNPRRIVAAEPELFGDDRWALFVDGSVALMASDRIADLRPEEPEPSEANGAGEGPE